MVKYDKHNYERYAKLTLDIAFPEWRMHFKKCDRPDLQDEIDGIGIEVTSSTPSYIRKADSYGAELLGRKVSVEEEESFLGEFFLTPDRVAFAYSPTKGLVDSDRSPEIIASISRKRSVWKEKKYKDFCVQGLYIFIGTAVFDDWMLEKIEKSKDFHFFQIVIINAMDRIYYYQDGWKKKEFTDEELAEFKKKALEAGEKP